MSESLSHFGFSMLDLQWGCGCWAVTILKLQFGERRGAAFHLGRVSRTTTFEFLWFGLFVR